MKPALSMFGLTNGKELILRARSQGVPVSDEFLNTNRFTNINDVADRLEATYGIRVVGENVFPTETWFVWSDELSTRLQSTITPGCFVTVGPGNNDLVNDMCESGLYRVWGTL